MLPPSTRRGHRRRLRAAASFQGLKPRALACCPIIDYDTPQQHTDGVKQSRSKGNKQHGGIMMDPSSGFFIPNTSNSSNARIVGSICAVAGPEGIACFHSTTPHKPYTILRHMAPLSRNITALAFQPMELKALESPISVTFSRKNAPLKSNNSGPLLLASAAGNGIMIWDASGHAMSPLLKRLTSCVSSSTTARASPLHELHHRAYSVMQSSPRMAGISDHKINPSMNVFDLSETVAAALADPGMFDERPSSPTSVVSTWDEITSLCWKPTTQPLLVTSSSRQVSLWDLRTHQRPGDSLIADKPSQKLASLSSKGTKFVHVACSAQDEHQLGIMDMDGTVQVIDDRMAGPLENVRTFRAYTGQGVGITSVGCDTHSSAQETTKDANALWITWGWDKEDELPLEEDFKLKPNCTAKVWAPKAKQLLESPEADKPTRNNELDHDDYWRFEASSADDSSMGDEDDDEELRISKSRSSKLASVELSQLQEMSQVKMLEAEVSDFDLVSHLKSHPIHCVRTCPAPFHNRFVTLGPARKKQHNEGDQKTKPGQGWKADLYRVVLKSKKSSSGSIDESLAPNIAHVTTFRGGGGGVDPALDYLLSGPVPSTRARDSQLMQDSDRYGTIVGAELTLAILAETRLGAELELCCLSSKGYVTVHAVTDNFDRSKAVEISPGAISPGNSSPARAAQQMKYLQAAMPSETIYRLSTQSHGSVENELKSILTPSLQFRKQWEQVMTDVESSKGLKHRKFSVDENSLSSHNAPSYLRLTDADRSTQFDLESAMVSCDPSTKDRVEQKEKIGDGGSEIAKLPPILVDSVTSRRIPCPRLCAATFSPGGNGLAIFKNGEIRNLWYWFKTSHSAVQPYDEMDSNLAEQTQQQIASLYPKTFLDMLKLKKAIKLVGEWEDDDNDEDEHIASDGSAANTKSDNSSNSSDDDADEEEADDETELDVLPHSISGIRSLSKEDSVSNDLRSKSKGRRDDGSLATVGPSPDLLSPTVLLTQKYDPMSLNEQSAELAENLNLGEWSVPRDVTYIRGICELNAKACSRLGLQQKAEVWKILAQLVLHNSMAYQRSSPTSISEMQNREFSVGFALGKELVSNILRYYEAECDVQMLATIICVLSGGVDRRRTIKAASYDGTNLLIQQKRSSQDGVKNSFMLVEHDDHRYDAYIRLYSALLYGWGMLTTRSELMKHLAYALPGAGGEVVMPAQTPKQSKSNNSSETPHRTWTHVVPNYGIGQGIDFAPLCPRCTKPADSDTNVCPNCQDYGFRCAICSNSVRGLFTSCFTCGHGGHVEHIMDWFSSQTVCPSGCGCSCVYNTFDPKGHNR